MNAYHVKKKNTLEKKKNIVFLKRLEQAGEVLKLGGNEKEMLKMNEEDNEELEEAFCQDMQIPFSKRKFKNGQSNMFLVVIRRSDTIYPARQVIFHTDSQQPKGVPMIFLRTSRQAAYRAHRQITR